MKKTAIVLTTEFDQTRGKSTENKTWSPIDCSQAALEAEVAGAGRRRRRPSPTRRRVSLALLQIESSATAFAGKLASAPGADEMRGMGLLAPVK